MAITTIALTDKVSVAFGLSWRTVDAFAPRHAQIQQWREEGYQTYASARANGEEQLGLISDRTSNEAGTKDGQLYSAAALLALHPELRGQTVLILLQGEEEAYAIGLQGGGITVDEAVPYHEVSALRARFTKECQQHNRDFRVVGVLEGNHASTELGHLDGTLTWSALVAKTMPSSARLRPLTSGRAIKLIAVAVVCLLGIVSLLQGYRWNQAREEHKRRLAVERANDPALLYAKAVEKFATRPDAAAPLTSGIRTLREIVGAVPVQRASWQLRRVDCTVVASICSAEWIVDKSRLATFHGFKSASPALPAHWQIELGPQLDRVVATIPISTSRSPIKAPELRPTFQTYLASGGSRLQELARLGFGVVLKEPQLVDVGSGTPRAIAEASPAALRAASWAVTGQPWWLVDGLEGVSDDMTLDQVSATYTGREVRFTAEGKIYVRN